MSKFERSRRLLEKKERMLAIESLSRFANLDVGREKRKGLPEVILAEGKFAREVAKISQAMVRRTGRAIISRCDAAQLGLLELSWEKGLGSNTFRSLE